jgi:A/G-specific adenine glycosylase
MTLGMNALITQPPEPTDSAAASEAATSERRERDVMVTGAIIRAVKQDGSPQNDHRSSARARRAPRVQHVPEVPIDPVRDRLLAHYDQHKRSMPWRETRDPYAIWVSEVMLQQTRVETVIPYFLRFIERFESVRALADAAESDVLALWAGLGYYRRARMLHAGAKHVVREHGGIIPAEIEALRAIPGVGRYTAGAIASIAFGLREPVLDGNVERVLTRIAALAGDPRRGPLREALWSLAARFADHARAGDVNQALMELGATLCAPTNPRCLLCPARADCGAHRRGEPERYPEKSAKRAPRVERWSALVLLDAGGHVWLGPPPSSLDRWKGMLVTPLWLEGQPAPAAAKGARPAAVVSHALTHARMEITVLVGELSPGRRAPALEGAFVARSSLSSLAVPKVTRVILEAVCEREVAAGSQRSVSPESTAAASSRTKASMRLRKGRAKKGSSSSTRT